MREPGAPSQLLAPDRISATQVEVGRKCPLRFLLDSSSGGAYPLPNASPARYVGTVFHSLIEDARCGQAGDPPQRGRLEDLWRDRLSEVEEFAKREGDACWLPLAESCRYLEQSRLWALEMAAKQSVTSGGTGNGVTEVRVQTRDGLVVGRIDVVEVDSGRVTLKDFKSGEIIDSNGPIRPDHETQMHVYAALFREERGSWPDRLALVDRRGGIHILSYEPKVASETLESARALVSRLRETVRGGDSLPDDHVRDLADTEAGVCASCRSRPVCPRYMEKLLSSGLIVNGRSRFPNLDIAGTVKGVQVSTDGRVRLDLAHQDELRSIAGLSRHGEFQDPELGEEVPELPLHGDRIAVFDALPKSPFDLVEATHLVPSRSVRAFRFPAAESPVSS